MCKETGKLQREEVRRAHQSRNLPRWIAARMSGSLLLTASRALRISAADGGESFSDTGVSVRKCQGRGATVRGQECEVGGVMEVVQSENASLSPFPRGVKLHGTCNGLWWQLQTIRPPPCERQVLNRKRCEKGQEEAERSSRQKLNSPTLGRYTISYNPILLDVVWKEPGGDYTGQDSSEMKPAMSTKDWNTAHKPKAAAGRRSRG